MTADKPTIEECIGWLSAEEDDDAGLSDKYLLSDLESAVLEILRDYARMKAIPAKGLVVDARRGLMALRLEVPHEVADGLTKLVEGAFGALSADNDRMKAMLEDERVVRVPKEIWGENGPDPRYAKLVSDGARKVTAWDKERAG